VIKINLLPPEIHVAEVQKQFSILGGIAGGILAVVLLGFWGMRHMQTVKLQKELTVANAELTKYQAIVDQVNQLEATRNQLRARYDVIQQLLKGRLIYPKFFEDFMAQLPSEIWVQSMQTSGDPQQKNRLNVSVSAQSLSSNAIADWLTNLHKCAYFSGVELGTISMQENSEGIRTLSFTLRFAYLREDA